MQETLARKGIEAADFYLRTGQPEAARAELRNVVRDYPESDRAPEARAKIQDLREILAVKKFLNGRQYYRHKRYTSAVVYLRAVWEDYPEAEIVPEALVLLARSLDRIDRRDEACDVLLLLEGLPQTEERDDYLRDARDLRKDWKCPQGNQTTAGGA